MSIANKYQELGMFEETEAENTAFENENSNNNETQAETKLEGLRIYRGQIIKNNKDVRMYRGQVIA